MLLPLQRKLLSLLQILQLLDLRPQKSLNREGEDMVDPNSSNNHRPAASIVQKMKAVLDSLRREHDFILADYFQA